MDVARILLFFGGIFIIRISQIFTSVINSLLISIPKPFGFKIAVFPVKIENASAGWVRALAIID